jgi:endonuclease/exonuclease/phosphatase family metal-dependent hydrolase
VTLRADGITLRVATWNILHGLDLQQGRSDLTATAAAITALDADVVALQEVDRGLPRSEGTDQAAEIGRRLGLHATFAPALLGDPDTSWTAMRGAGSSEPGYGVALLSRYALTGITRMALPGGGDGRRRPRSAPSGNPGWDREPRIGLRATITVDGRALTIATTHLSYLPWRGLRQLRRLVGALDGAGPAVLLGDFNLPPGAVGFVAGGGWAGAGGEATYPASAPRLQVDQILVRGVQVTDVHVGAAATSDHRPVVADLLLP